MAQPGAGGFEVETPIMRQANQHVFAVNEAIQAQLSTLLGRLEPLVAAWQGEAAMTFQQVKTRWNDSARRLNDALRGIGDLMSSNTVNYERSEEASRTGFTPISAALG